MLTAKKQQRGLVVAVETMFDITASLRKIALHIVSYMTVLHLFNDRTNFKSMRFLKLRQIPLSAMVNGPHYPQHCLLMVFAPLSSLQMFEIRKYVFVSVI